MGSTHSIIIRISVTLKLYIGNNNKKLKYKARRSGNPQEGCYLYMTGNIIAKYLEDSESTYVS